MVEAFQWVLVMLAMMLSSGPEGGEMVSYMTVGDGPEQRIVAKENAEVEDQLDVFLAPEEGERVLLGSMAPDETFSVVTWTAADGSTESVELAPLMEQAREGMEALEEVGGVMELELGEQGYTIEHGETALRFSTGEAVLELRSE